MNAYEFIIKMRNMVSSQLHQIASELGITSNKAEGLNSKMKNVESTSKSMGDSMGKLKGIIASVFAVAAMVSFTNKVVDARAEYEKYNAVLANTFQDAAVGAAALNMLTEFAAKTPFQLDNLTGSFVKLVNRGITPTYQEMTNLGDLAASQGHDFDQLTEAVLDAGEGQFRMLKQFGIHAESNGKQVELTFKGITKSVAETPEAITKAIESFGALKGVAGGMDMISKTLGGQISNLKDQWNEFLVNVGGQSSGIFNFLIAGIKEGLTFLTDYLPYVSQWFHILWDDLMKWYDAINRVLGAFFGFHTIGSILTTFGNIMTGVLLIVDWFVQGALAPLGQFILKIIGAWAIWNGVVAIFNLLMAVNPITWLIIGIIALIMVIGMVSKYTSGWGESWRHVVTGAKLIWQTYTDYVKANFNTVVNALMIGIDKIKLGWYKFKEAIGIGNSTENQKMIAEINNDVEARKKSIVDGYKKMIKSASDAKKEFGQVGVTVDTNGIKRDFQGIKDKFKNVGGTRDMSTSAYDNYLKKQQAAKGKKDDDKKDNIVSGGSKITHINITIHKLQDDTKIFVSSAEKGLDNMGEKVQEILLRAVNSVNQMQTD